jgi:hypothetical protein
VSQMCTNEVLGTDNIKSKPRPRVMCQTAALLGLLRYVVGKSRISLDIRREAALVRVLRGARFSAA